MKIFFSVGEPSGDLHGANLIRELRGGGSDFEFVGYGGPRMAAAGCQLHEDLTKLAVMWFARVLLEPAPLLGPGQPGRPLLPPPAAGRGRADRLSRASTGGSPGGPRRTAFRCSTTARRRSGRGPAGGSRRCAASSTTCSANCRSKRPGTASAAATRPTSAIRISISSAAKQLDAAFIEQQRSGDGPLVAILPGSRTQEVKSNFGYFLKAARLVHERVPNARFAVASFKPSQAEMVREQLRGVDLPIEVHVGRTAELIAAAECTMAVSGSVSLELLYHTKPTVILYYISPLAFFLQKFFRKVRYITLVNLLVTDDLFPKKVAAYDPNDPVDAKVLMPEYLTCEDKSRQVAAHVVEWLTDPAKRAARVAQLAALKEQVGYGGASKRAADYMLRELDRVGQTTGAADALSVRHAARRSGPRRGVAFSGGARSARFRIAEQAPPLIAHSAFRYSTSRLSDSAMLLAEPPPSQADLHFRVFGIPVRVHPWFWIVVADAGHGRQRAGRSAANARSGSPWCSFRSWSTNWATRSCSDASAAIRGSRSTASAAWRRATIAIARRAARF